MRSCATLFFLIFYLTTCATIQTQIPIGLRPSASFRDLIIGTAIGIRYLQGNVDDGRYSSYLNQNYVMIVPGSELMARHIWIGENQYNFNDSDWLVGATSNSTGWAQQNYVQIRGHNLYPWKAKIGISILMILSLKHFYFREIIRYPESS